MVMVEIDRELSDELEDQTDLSRALVFFSGRFLDKSNHRLYTRSSHEVGADDGTSIRPCSMNDFTSQASSIYTTSTEQVHICLIYVVLAIIWLGLSKIGR